MIETRALTGGCLCRAVRYRLDEVPFDAGYCHCRTCQVWAGAPVMAFATVGLSAFVLTAGEARKVRSSDFGQRWFCADCGSSLAMQVDHQPDTIDFALASLDEPDLVAPGFHIWTDHRITWFDTRDALPRFGRFRPHIQGLKAQAR